MLRGSDRTHRQCTCLVGKEPRPLNFLSSWMQFQTMLCKRCFGEAVGVPSLVVAIPEGGHVPIFEGGLIRSVFFEAIQWQK